MNSEPTDAEREGYKAWMEGIEADNWPNHYSGGSRSEEWQRGWRAESPRRRIAAVVAALFSIAAVVMPLIPSALPPPVKEVPLAR